MSRFEHYRAAIAVFLFAGIFNTCPIRRESFFFKLLSSDDRPDRGVIAARQR